MATARSASLWAIVGNIATRGLSFVFFLLIARVLSPAHLGVMALALAVGLFLDAVIEFGLVDQVVRHHDADDQAFFSAVFWLHLGLSVAGVLLMFALAPWAARWYKEPELSVAMIGVSFSSAFTGVSLVPAALLTRRFDQKTLAKRNAVATLAGGVLGLGCAYAGWGVRALVVLQLVNAFTGMLMVWIGARWTPSRSWQWASVQPVLPLARHSLGTRLLDTVINRIDQLLIGSIFGATALGLYALAMRLFDVLFQSVCLPIAGVMLPYLAPSARDLDAFRQRYLLVLKTTALCVPPLFLCGALFLPGLLPVLFGAKWAPAAPYIQIVLGIGAIQAMAFTHSPAFAALGKPWANLVSSGVATLAWLAALYMLPGKGAIYAAVLWAFRGLLGNAVQIGLMRRLTHLRLRDYWQATWVAWVGAGVLLALLQLMSGLGVWPDNPWWQTLIGGAMAVVLMGGMAFMHSEHIRNFVLAKARR